VPLHVTQVDRNGAIENCNDDAEDSRDDDGFGEDAAIALDPLRKILRELVAEKENNVMPMTPSEYATLQQMSLYAKDLI